MIKLYRSNSSGIIHWVVGGYICMNSIGKIEYTMEGSRDDITCKNCKDRLN